MVQGQGRVPGVHQVSGPQPAHHRLHRDVGEAEGGGGEDVSDARIHLGVVAPIGRHEEGRGLLPQDPRQVVLPGQDLNDGELGLIFFWREQM